MALEPASLAQLKADLCLKELGLSGQSVQSPCSLRGQEPLSQGFLKWSE